MKKEFNALVKRKPTYINSTDDIKNAVLFLRDVRELKAIAKEKYEEERAELAKQLDTIDAKYNTIIKALDDVDGEVRGKITNYAKVVINNGGVIEKRIEVSGSILTFVGDKSVTVENEKELIKAIAEGEYPTTFVKPQLSELKKYAKATQKGIAGCKIEDTVYFMIK